MEHLRHFQLAEDPFRNEGLERFLLETEPYRDALQRLERGVRQGKGLVVLVGGVGSGKTLVARRLYEELEEEVFEASMMVVLRGSADAQWLLTRFATQLGVEEPASEREALIGQIYERLAIIREDGRHAVLIVDDAHGLAARETLTEICGLTKLEYEDRRLLTVVLVGAPRLEAEIARDSLVAHHLEVIARMHPLTGSQVESYLATRLERAEGRPELLEAEAVAALEACSGGLPGLLNILADNALFEAFLAGRDRVTRVDVERAYADLGWASVASASGPGALPGSDARSIDVSQESPPATHPVPVHAASAAEAGPLGPGRGAEFTRPLMAPVEDDSLADLDSELEAVFEPGAEGPAEAPSTVLMDLAGESPAAGALPAEQRMDFESAPVADAPRPEGPGLAEAQSTILMDLEAEPSAGPPHAVAETAEIELGPADALDLEGVQGPPKQGDEVDELFMELLDD